MSVEPPHPPHWHHWHAYNWRLYQRPYRFGFGRRLVWFALGAGAATWYMRKHQDNYNGIDSGWGCHSSSRRRREIEAGEAAPAEGTRTALDAYARHNEHHRHWGFDRHYPPPASAPVQSRPIAPSAVNANVPVDWDSQSPSSPVAPPQPSIPTRPSVFDEELERARQFRQAAAAKVSILFTRS
jgi:hypothetical protein